MKLKKLSTFIICVITMAFYSTFCSTGYSASTDIPTSLYEDTGEVVVNTDQVGEVTIQTGDQWPLSLTAKSAILMEVSGKVLLDSSKDEKLPPASVTKVMTMLLIMEALDSGEINLNNMVTCSEYAASMSGSQVFLEPGEQMSVNDLLKAIAIASANDACVMMAEYIAGSNKAFIDMMNKRAKELHMQNTNFINCTGLSAANHYTTAYDIALMSAELLRHPKILEYTSIWIDTLRDGQFGLANLNKFIRFYKGANGLTIGSTSEALFCLSVSAQRDNMTLIAVVLGSPTSEERFDGASKLLNYGFEKWMSIELSPKEKIAPVCVRYGKKDRVAVAPKDGINIVIEKEREKNIESHMKIPPYIKAPVEKGQQIGEIIYTMNDKEVFRQQVVALSEVKIQLWYAIFQLIPYLIFVVIIGAIVLLVIRKMKKRCGDKVE